MTSIASRCLVLAGRSAAWAVQQAPVPRLPRLVTASARGVLARIDLTDLVCRLVDLNRIAARLDLEPIIARIDVDAVVARADLDRIIARIDLIGLASYVADGIDLPDLVRESTGSMTSEMVRDVRTQSAAADHQVERAIDRLLLRRHDRNDGEALHHSGDELDGPG